MAEGISGHRIGDALRTATTALGELPNPRLDAELLLAKALTAARTDLYRDPERQLSNREFARFENFVTARRSGRPIAYITGETEFWSLRLSINEHVLVPRPDTEVLVEQALGVLNRGGDHEVIDLGTGSGAVAAALAHERPDLNVLAIDREFDAVTLAQANFRALGHQRIRVVCGNWLDACRDRSADVIVCNPPYVDRADTASYDASLRYEPEVALFAGDSGLSEIHVVIDAARNILRNGGALLLEHGYEQGDAVGERLQEKGYSGIKTFCDLNQHPRVTVGFTS